MTAASRSWKARLFRRTVALPFAVGALADCSADSPAAARQPALLVAHAGDGESAPVGSALVITPVAMVLNDRGETLPGVHVHFVVRQGGGSVLVSDTTTDAAGTASPGRWTLGRTPGTNELEADVGGVSPLLFRATALIGPAANMRFAPLLALQGVVGTSLTPVPTVRVTDALDNPVAGAVVRFSVVTGQLGVTEAATDTAGIATPGSWTLGTAAGPQTLTASTRLSQSDTSLTALATIRAVAGPPAAVAMVSPDSQGARPGRALTSALVGRVVDSFGNAVANMMVTWTDTTDLPSPVASISDSAGIVRLNVRLGAHAGPRTVSVAGPGLAAARFTVLGLPAISISLSNANACELLANGALYCWGSSVQGTADGPPGCSAFCAFRTAPGLLFRSMGTGPGGACGVTLTEDVQCWGANWYGELGNGLEGIPSNGQAPPGKIAAPGAFTTLIAGDNSRCALLATGSAFCWGWNANGSLGLGFRNAPNNAPGYGVDTPLMMSAPGRIASMALSEATGCLITTAQDLWCWGNVDNPNGVDSITAGRLEPAGAYASVSLNSYFICALLLDGEARCRNASGAKPSFWKPFVPDYGAWDPAPGVRFRSIAVGAEHMCGVRTDGIVVCWGSNAFGQLGDGSGVDRVSPPQPINMGGNDVRFTTVAAWEKSTCAITTTGDVYCWGYNVAGQLGDGTRDTRVVPVLVR